MKNISNRMTKLLPKETVRLLKDIGALADSLGFSAFLVGGIVRDLLLGIKSLDLDIAVEGDGIKLGQAFAEKMSAEIVVHKQFGTCSVTIKDGFKIDFATARRESYVHPGAFPKVKFSPLKDDLIRRDFTINAMAVSLDEGDFGRLIDLFGGEHDLAKRRIRVMHEGSFLDDPTRMLRAVRFEQRLGFIIEKSTLKFIKAAIQARMMGKISKPRVRKELALIDKEKNRDKMLNRLEELSLWNYAKI